MATRNKRAKITLDTTAMTVTYEPFDATGKPDGRKVSISPLDYNDSIRNLLMLDRLRNKAMDSYSDPTADVIESVRAVHEQLVAGNWTARGTGEKAETTSLFVEAYARHTFKMPGQGESQGMSLEEWTINRRNRVNEIEAGDDETAKNAVKSARTNVQIKLLMAKIKEEKAREAAKAAAANAKTAGATELATF